MFDFLAGQSSVFHLIFGCLAVVIGMVLLRLWAAHRDHGGGTALPPHLRFMQGQGMPGLVRLGGWLALAGGLVIILSAILLASA